MQLFIPCVHTHTHAIVHMYRSEKLAEVTFPFCHVGPETKAGRLGLGAAPWPLHQFASPMFLFWNRLSLSCPVRPVLSLWPKYKPWLCCLIAFTTRIVGVHAWATRPGLLWHLWCCLTSKLRYVTAQACPQLLLVSHAQGNFSLFTLFATMVILSHVFIKDILQLDYSALTIITRTNNLYGGCLSDQRPINYTMRHLKNKKNKQKWNNYFWGKGIFSLPWLIWKTQRRLRASRSWKSLYL